MAENTSNQTKMDAQRALTSREKGSSFCLLHKETPFTFTCDDCNNELICVFCISKNHKGHKATLKETTAELCVKFLKEFQQEEKASIETGRKRITLAQKCYKESESFYDKEIKRIEKQNDELIQNIETYTKSLISSLENLKKKNEMRLLGCVNKVNSSIEAKHHLIYASTEALESNSVVFIIDSTYQITKLQCLLPNILKPLSGVHFVPADITETCTRNLFGTLEKQSSKLSVSGSKHGHKNTEIETNCVPPRSNELSKEFSSIGIQATENLDTFTKCLENLRNVKYTQTESNWLSEMFTEFKSNKTTSEICKTENQAKHTQTDIDLQFYKCKEIECNEGKEKKETHVPLQLCLEDLQTRDELPKATSLETMEFSESITPTCDSFDTNETSFKHPTPTIPNGEKGKPPWPESISIIHKLFFKPRCIIQMKDGMWCTFRHRSPILHFFNNNFSSSDTHTMEEKIINMALGPKNKLYLLFHTGSVGFININKKICLVHLFQINKNVESIGVTPEENIISCCFEQKSISLLKENGVKLKQNNHLDDYPRQIAVCQKTGKIALGCKSSLIVLDAELQKLYLFNGDRKYICVWGVGFDFYGHVLCTHSEIYRSKLYVLDAEKGNTHKSIYLQHFGYPQCLTVQTNGCAVIGMDSDQQLVSVNYLHNEKDYTRQKRPFLHTNNS